MDYHVPEVFYTDNINFINQNQNEPINIEEIRYNLMLKYLGENYVDPVKRYAIGIGLYLFAIGFACLCVYAVSVFFEARQYLLSCFWILFSTLSVVMIAQSSLRYLTDKTEFIDKLMNDFYMRGQFLRGKITQTITSGSSIKIVYFFSSPTSSSDMGIYRALTKADGNLEKKRITVWYVDRRLHTIL